MGLFIQTTYDLYEDRYLTIGLSQSALRNLMSRIRPGETAAGEHDRGSFEHLGHLDRFVVIIPTTDTDRVTVSGTEIGVWLSASSLTTLIQGSERELSYALRVQYGSGRPVVEVLGEKDGFTAACRIRRPFHGVSRY